MKRMLVAIVLVCLGVSGVGAQPAEPPPADNAILFQPVAVALTLLVGIIEVTVEYQHAFGEYFVLSVMPDVAFAPGYGFVGGGAFLGLIAHPLGGGLRGFYIGAYPGILYIEPVLMAAAIVDVGYQWVTRGGLVFGVGGGGKYTTVTGIGFNITINLGFAF
ncbi:MAG: hypothetical protein JW820_14720 [Spirochaetales bacterium]|nr:hypothetical protein [Spirochaetales bacterium]